MEKNKPIQFIECKLKQKEINPALRYIKQRFPGVDAAQIALYGEEDDPFVKDVHGSIVKEYLPKISAFDHFSAHYEIVLTIFHYCE